MTRMTRRKLPSGTIAYSPHAELLHRICDVVWDKAIKPKLK